MNEIKQLIADTVSGARIESAGNSVIANDAGLELIDVSATAAAEIETALADLVRLTGSVPDTSSRNLIGLNYLFGAFLIGSVKSNRDASFEFLKTLPAAWLVEAVSAASTFFWKTKFGYNFNVGPNPALLGFVCWAKSHESCDVSSMANQVLQKFKQSTNAADSEP